MKIQTIAALAACAAFAVPAAYAQEETEEATAPAVEESAEKTAEETAEVAQEEAPSAPVEEVVDGGVEAVYMAEEAAPAEPPPPEPKDAFAEVKAWAKDKGFKVGRWDGKKKRLVVAVKEQFDCEDPATMADVMIQRDMATKRAILQAKAEIIQYVKEEVSAEDIVEMLGANAPGTSDAAKKEVEAEVAKIKGTTLKQTSTFAGIAELPLFGVTSLKQSESWNRGKYQIAIVMAWSPKLERSARAVITGEKVVAKPKDTTKSLDDWLESVNPAFMSGPLQYIDNDGKRWFMGISAMPVDDELDSLTIKKNTRIADLSAKQMCAFSLWADVKAYEAMKQELTTTKMDGKTVSEASADLEAKLSQKISGLPLRGGAYLYRDEVEHPVVGGKIYVAIYAVEPDSAAAALKVEAINIATRAEVERVKTIERGRAAANNAHIDAAKDDPRDFQKGKAAQSKAIGAEVQTRRSAAKGKQTLQNREAPEKGRKSSAAGVFSSGAEADDDDI